MRHLVVLCFLLVLVFDRGDSLKCYSCETQDLNSPCEDLSKGKDKVNTEDCLEGEVCAVYTTKNPSTGVFTVSRSCESKDICEELRERSSDFRKLEKCKTCKTDLCDSGTTFSASAVTFILSLIIGAFIN